MAQKAFLFHRCGSSFIPTMLHIPKHLTHHLSLRQCGLTHNTAAHIPTYTKMLHTQRCRNMHTKVLPLHKLFQDLETMQFFHHLVTCSYISSFHHSTKHPGRLYPACTNTEPRPLGCFHMVINGLSECLYISCCSG